MFLGQAEGPEALAPRDLGEEATALLVIAERDERRAAERDVRLHRDPDGGIAATDLLDREAVGDEIAARAAVLGRQTEAQQPEVGHLRDDLVGELLGAVERGRLRADDALGEVAGEIAPASLLGGEVEVHRRLHR